MPIAHRQMAISTLSQRLKRLPHQEWTGAAAGHACICGCRPQLSICMGHAVSVHMWTHGHHCKVPPPQQARKAPDVGGSHSLLSTLEVQSSTVDDCSPRHVTRVRTARQALCTTTIAVSGIAISLKAFATCRNSAWQASPCVRFCLVSRASVGLTELRDGPAKAL